MPARFGESGAVARRHHADTPPRKARGATAPVQPMTQTTKRKAGCSRRLRRQLQTAAVFQRKLRRFADNARKAAVPKRLFRHGQDGRFVACLRVDNAIRPQACFGERRCEKVPAPQNPNDSRRGWLTGWFIRWRERVRREKRCRSLRRCARLFRPNLVQARAEPAAGQSIVHRCQPQAYPRRKRGSPSRQEGPEVFDRFRQNVPLATSFLLCSHTKPLGESLDAGCGEVSPSASILVVKVG